MSDQHIDIEWEWPAGRQLESKMLINVTQMSKASKGFLGMGASPSLANALPDATIVIGSVMSGSEQLIGKTISIRLPGVEAKKLKLGEPAAVALIGSSVCICVAAKPADTGEVSAWFNGWNCN